MPELPFFLLHSLSIKNFLSKLSCEWLHCSLKIEDVSRKISCEMPRLTLTSQLQLVHTETNSVVFSNLKKEPSAIQELCSKEEFESSLAEMDEIQREYHGL